MTTASWNGVLIAQSDATVVVEGNHYFPPEAVRREYLRPSPTITTCRWKGVARYDDVVINGRVNPDAAWHYDTPSERARHIAGYIAFWHGIEIRE